MSSKALYVSLIMTLIGVQAGLQTASGLDSGLQDSSGKGSYTATFDSTMAIKSKAANSMTPQASPDNCAIAYSADQTNVAGDALIYCQGCVFRNPICGTYQNDFPHRITFDIEQNGQYLRVKSWAPWYDVAAGPIWYSCHFLICH